MRFGIIQTSLILHSPFTIFASANAKIAQLVEHNLAKVRVAGSSPVFRSNGFARMVESVDTKDLKSFGYNTAVRVQVPLRVPKETNHQF